MFMKKISIVVPCYNEEESLEIFYKETSKVMEEIKKKVEVEYILVNDGSNDKTLQKMRKLSSENENIIYLSFSRNFGKEAAMLAGFKASTGDYVAVMDADLQDPPKLLPEMFEILEQKEYDCVGTRRVTRTGEPPIRSFLARCFYKIINRLSKVEMVDGARDFRLMTRQMVDAILAMPEYNRYSKGIFSFVGFETKWLEYENVKRVAGETKWNIWKLLLYAMDGIIAFSTVPLNIAAILGVLFCLGSFIAILVIITKTICFGDPVGGWPSMVCIMFFLSGIQLFCTGIIGAYLSKTYLESKKRPIYIVKETNKKSSV